LKLILNYWYIDSIVYCHTKGYPEGTVMRVVFDLVGKRISIEGDGSELVAVLQAAREIAPQITEINLVTGTGNLATQTGGQAVNDEGGVEQLVGQTLKQFTRSLDLGNASERIAAIAYYLKHHSEEEIVTPKNMSRLFTTCGFQKPSQMGVAFSDARRQHDYVENVGRGEWRITTNGENLIVGKLNEIEE